MGYCPTCGKLVAIVPAPRDTFGRPRKRVVPHDRPKWGGPALMPFCAGSNALV